MANLFDYLSWRGDLPFDRAEFNDVDSLILCALSYVPLDGVVPGHGEGEPVPLALAAERFFAKEGVTLPAGDARDFDERGLLLLSALARCPRFSALPLSGYVSRHDLERSEQFSALTAALSETEGYVAFRGTDNSLVGWKEDFHLAFLSQIPSQRSARAYLEGAAAAFLRLRVGGHSKGGNLAVYAAASCGGAARAKLSHVYNNDGPGFCGGALDGAAYGEVRARIRTFVPQSSVVGMLLEHEEDYTVVHSTQVGILQHDPYSWEVLGPAFVRLDEVTQGSRFLNRALKDWIAGMDADARARFTDALFELLGAANASTLAELSSDWLHTAGAVLQKLKDMDEGKRALLTQTLGLLIRSARETAAAALPRPRWELSKKEDG